VQIINFSKLFGIINPSYLLPHEEAVCLTDSECHVQHMSCLTETVQRAAWRSTATGQPHGIASSGALQDGITAHSSSFAVVGVK
jgi:hypothetical protein